MRNFEIVNPYECPIGDKLKSIGYSDVIDYVSSNDWPGFELFCNAIDFPSLAPIGFYVYLVSLGVKKKDFDLVSRIYLSDGLNEIKRKCNVDSPNFDFRCASLSSSYRTAFSPEYAEANLKADRVIEHLRNLSDTKTLCVNFDADWLCEIFSEIA